MIYRIENYHFSQMTNAMVDNAINKLVAEGWRIHTFSTSGNGYIGGHIATVLFESD